MNAKDKLGLIEDYESAYDPIRSLVEGLSPEAFRFLPPLADAWSINDHLVHLLDAEAAVFFRIRAAIAEPGFAIPVWEEELWHARLPYGAQDGLECLKLVFGLRRTLGATLRASLDADWEGFWVQHPLKGRMTVADLLRVYTDHAAFHTPFIKRNREAFERRA